MVIGEEAEYSSCNMRGSEKIFKTYTMRVVKHWKRSLEAVASLSLEIFRTQWDMALSNSM